MSRAPSNRSPLIIPALLFIAVLGMVEGVIYTYKGKVESDQRLQALQFAADLRSSAERELNNVLNLTSGLAGYFSVRHDSLQKDEILDILRIAYETSPGVRNFGVAVDYQLKYLYPSSGNESAIGLDYRTLPRQWPDVQRAIRERRPVLSEGVNLVQGGEAFVYRDPIYINDEYWGLLSTVIDAEPLLSAMFSQAEGDDRHDFAVRSLKSGESLSLWGPSELFEDPHSVTLMSGRQWEYAVKLQENNTHWLPVFVLRMFGWVLALVAGFGGYSMVMSDRQRHAPPTGERSPVFQR